MVERARAPLGNGVTAGTIFFASRFHELPAVNIFMALEALLGRMREVSRRFDILRRRCRRFVAPNTGGVLVSAFERKFRRGVIKAADFTPITRVVAGVARLLGGVRVHMASGAGLIGEMILPGRRRRAAMDVSRGRVIHVRHRFVTVGAEHGRMCVDQPKLGFRVTAQIESGWAERLLRMAEFTAVLIGRCAEFAAVRISMAIGAEQLAGFVDGFFAGRLVTEIAFEFGVLTFQLERALLVHLSRIKRRLEIGFIVAGGTVRARSAAVKLTAMDVFVALAAQSMRYRRAKIVVLVALLATGFPVFAAQRKVGLTVIEAARRNQRFPPGCRVASLAGALERRVLERAFVRIGMAVLAVGEGQPFVPRCGFAGFRGVTFHACDIRMKTGQREGCPEVIESLGRLPCVLAMTAETICA